MHDVKHMWNFDHDALNLDDILEKIAFDLYQAENPGVILIVANATEAAKLVIKIKETGLINPIFGTDSMGNITFIKALEEKVGKRNVANYADGIYTISFAIFAIAGGSSNVFLNNFVSKYRLIPTGDAAAYYDAAGITLQAIEFADNRGTTVRQKRKEIQKYLSAINMENAYEGASGKIFFDNNGSAIKSIAVGMYKKGNLIPAMVQLVPKFDARLISNYRNA
jgi:ABC-type branched-subunit amino acid transport system substrate-binding protein